MGLTDIKNSLKTVIQGVTSVKSVYTHMPKNQSTFPSVIIFVEKSHEVAATLGNPGRRHIHYTAELRIQSIDPTPNEQTSQQSFEDMLDGIDTALRNNKASNGTWLKCAWDYIDTDIFDPQLSGQGQGIIMRAIKTFEVLVEIIA